MPTNSKSNPQKRKKKREQAQKKKKNGTIDIASTINRPRRSRV